MSFRSLFIIVPLVGFLVVAVFASYRMWTSITGDLAMNGNGIAALVIGGVGTLLIGGVLMGLVFYSARRGYDEAADLKSRPFEDR